MQRNSVPDHYDTVLLITEAIALLLAIWIIWVAQMPSLV